MNEEEFDKNYPYIPLSMEQVDFLEYIQHNHESFGHPLTVKRILNNLRYHSAKDIVFLNGLRVIFDKLRNGNKQLIKQYGEPTKYLDND